MATDGNWSERVLTGPVASGLRAIFFDKWLLRVCWSALEEPIITEARRAVEGRRAVWNHTEDQRGLAARPAPFFWSNRVDTRRWLTVSDAYSLAPYGPSRARASPRSSPGPREKPRATRDSRSRAWGVVSAASGPGRSSTMKCGGANLAARRSSH